MDHFVNATVSSDLWHARMGHIHAALISKLPISCKSKVLDVCDSCCLTKQHIFPFSDSTHTSEKLFDLVHADLWVPYKFKTHGQCNMFLTLVEDKSRCTWIYLLSDKSMVFSLIRDFFYSNSKSVQCYS